MLNTDARKLERTWNSKIPNANEIKKLICEYDEGFDITKKTALEQNQQTNVNPVKRLWEAKGIRFPGRGILPNSSSTPSSSGCSATRGAEPVFYSDFAISFADNLTCFLHHKKPDVGQFLTAHICMINAQDFSFLKQDKKEAHCFSGQFLSRSRSPRYNQFEWANESMWHDVFYLWQA